MNCNYRSIWNDKTGTFVAVSENAMSAGRSASCRETKPDRSARFFLKAMAVSLLAAFGGNIYALPVGGVVSQGGAPVRAYLSAELRACGNRGPWCICVGVSLSLRQSEWFGLSGF